MIGPAAISRIVTIASPHHGTGFGRLFRSRPALQLRLDSPWLRALNAGEGAPPPVPLTSIYSLHDNLIVPPRTAILAGARLHELRGLGHLSLLSARQSIDCTLAALAIRAVGFGPLPLLGAAWLQRVPLDPGIVLISPALGCWVAAILLINEVPDCDPMHGPASAHWWCAMAWTPLGASTSA